ncbi:DUF4239 domain-containing protein [bacterium]|nr:DUF4239 domain-containing protein [bacterium]
MDSHLSFSIHDTIAATLGAMIAFAMVEAMSDYNAISTIVRTEASQINSLDRLLTRYGDHKFDHIRKDLILYSQSIVDDEWPELYFGRRSEKTQEAWAPISRGTVNIEPTNQREALLYADIIKLVDEISKTRDDRIGSSSMKIPFVFWLSISLLFFAKNLLSSCYKGSQEEDFALGVQNAVLAALVAVTFILNEHYIGQTSISPDPIKETILLMKNRTH